MVGVTVFIGSVHWWIAVYKYPVAVLLFSLPPSASILASAPLPSHARAPSSSSEFAFLPPKNACETRRRR
jgi:hypothetical protein